MKNVMLYVVLVGVIVAVQTGPGHAATVMSLPDMAAVVGGCASGMCKKELANCEGTCFFSWECKGSGHTFCDLWRVKHMICRAGSYFQDCTPGSDSSGCGDLLLDGVCGFPANWHCMGGVDVGDCPKSTAIGNDC